MPANLPPIVSGDGCTDFIQGNWRTCCDVHDLSYAVQLPKAVADASLAQCVADHGHSFIAVIMWVGVTVFGGWFYARARRREALLLDKSIPAPAGLLQVARNLELQMVTDTFDMPQLELELGNDEGCRSVIYVDTMGHPTVGVGHNLDAGPLPGETYPLSEARIDEIFRSDVAATIAKLDAYLPWWRTLDAVRQRVLINMAFNLGMGRPGSGTGLLAFGGFLGLVRMGDYAGAARDMLNTLWARQVPARAARLSQMMASGVAAMSPAKVVPKPPAPVVIVDRSRGNAISPLRALLQSFLTMVEAILNWKVTK
jgi:lysozyme